MNKNSFLNPKLVSKPNIAFALLILTMVGLFCSRAVMSMSMIGFGVAGLWGVHPREWVKDRFWLLGVLWVGLFALSFFWSHDTGYWLEHVQVKLPILLLPLAFRFLPSFSTKQLVTYSLFFFALATVGVCYSSYFLWQSSDGFIADYGVAKVLPTIPKNDHQVFSMFLALAIMWGVYLYPMAKGIFKWLLLLCSFMFSVFLHVLAARTGLVAWYVFLIGYCLYLLLNKRTLIKGLLLVIVFAIGAFAAVHFIPTLKQKLNYVKYSYEMFRQGDKTGNYSDIGRIISFQISKDIIKQHPLIGVGAGDMLDSMKGRYAVNYPQVEDSQRLVPHNQFLIAGVVAGIPCLLAFMAWVCYPLFCIQRNRNGFFLLVVWCMLLVHLMVEPMLETQFGLYIYLHFLLWQWHIMNKPITSRNKALAYD